MLLFFGKICPSTFPKKDNRLMDKNVCKFVSQNGRVFTRISGFFYLQNYSGLICNCSPRASFEEVDDEEDDGSNCK